MADYVGQQLGQYRLLRLISQSGFADVYLAEHIHLNTQAAIKIFQVRLMGSNLEQFRTEARTIASLAHPHIVHVLDFGVEDGAPFLAMDYAPNGTLRHHHPKGIPLPPSNIVSYVNQVASALQYAHDQKVIHRDVKPENMLVGWNNDILLSDFGLVMATQNADAGSVQGIVGTVAYMAPEQIQGKPCPASDQYALGIIVYEWLSGHCPFRGSLTEVMHQHMLTPPPSLREQVPDIAPELEQVVLTALAKDPHQRFSSVQAFATAFEQACPAVPSLSTASTLALPQLPTPATALSTSSSSPTTTPDTSQPLDTSQPPDRPQHPISRRSVIIGLVVAGSGLAGLGLFELLKAQPIHIPANLNLYVVAEPPSGSSAQHSFIYALRASDGSQRWRYMVDNSPSVKEVNDILYITTSSFAPPDSSTPSAAPPDIQGSLLALRASDGTLLWHYQGLSGSRFGGGGIGIDPLVDSGVVYISTGDQSGQNFVSALQASDGMLLWRYKLPGNKSIALAELQVINGVIYIGTGDQAGQNFVSALRTSDGMLLWHYKLPGNALTTLTGLHVVKGVAYISTEDKSSTGTYLHGTVYALQSSDGTLLWQYQANGQLAGIGIGNGRVDVFTFDYSETNSALISTSLIMLGSSDGKFLWQHKYGEIYGAQEINGVVYIGTSTTFQLQSGTVYALRANDGSILWQHQTSGAYQLVGVNKGVVYIAFQPNDTSHLVQALRASDGTLLWQKQFQGHLQSFSIIESGDMFYVITGTLNTYPPTHAVYALRSSDGAVLWNYEKQRGIVSRREVKDGVLYLGISEGNLPGTGGSVCAYQASDGASIWCQQTELGVSNFLVG